MTFNNWSRREIGRLAAAGLVGASSRGQGARITARQVSGQPIYVIPETTLGGARREVQTKLNVRSARMVGDPNLRVTRVGRGGHCIAQCMAMAPNVDVVIGGEVREWETVEYFRDSVATGERKGLIVLPHEGGEEAGMEECARWVRGFVTEVPIEFIASGDPFWIPQPSHEVRTAPTKRMETV